MDTQTEPIEISGNEQAAPVAQPIAKKAPLSVAQDGSFELRSLQDQTAFAARLIAEKMVSDTFKTASQLVIGFQYAKSLKLDPILAVRLMYVVNGRPCLYGEGPLSLCQRSGLVEKIEEFYLNEKMDRISVENKNLKDAAFASVTRIWRKGDSLPQEDFFTLEDLARAGVNLGKDGKKKDVWDKWERLMLRYKARTMALRSKFADVIAGIPIAEYDEHFTPEAPVMKEVKSTVADEINTLIEKKPDGQAVSDLPQDSNGPLPHSL